MMQLKKAGANWVDGDRFFNRKAEIDILTERVREGIHTLLTAPRRMGKTSLVRESLRRLANEEGFETIFIDLEDASGTADAIAEIAARSRTARGAWNRIRACFSDGLRTLGDRVDSVTVSELRCAAARGNQLRQPVAQG